MTVRVAATIGYGVLLGVTTYFDQVEVSVLSESAYEVFQGLAVGLTIVSLGVIAGFIVGRWWALLALLGPLLVLSYLQITGYVSPWLDGTPPLWWPRTVSLCVGFGFLLLLGVLARWLWARRHGGGQMSAL